jgi:tetratricopeptide (TPR) repeat protein
MSFTPTFTQPPEPLNPSVPPRSTIPPGGDEAPQAADPSIPRLRAEIEATADRARQARLLFELADVEERGRDDPAAARDYLAAFNADPTFREPLEGLVRLLEKRRSLKNLGKLIGALVRAAAAPDEKVRALLMRAAYQADVSGEIAEAKASVVEASEIDGVPVAEQATTWLMLEVLAGRTSDPASRIEAMAHRVRHAHRPAWRSLLLIDQAMLLVTTGEVDAALALMEEARAPESAATWPATVMIAEVARDHLGTPGSEEWRARSERLAGALEARARLIEQAMVDGGAGDSQGVPQWVRTPTRVVEAWVSTADARRAVGQLDRAGEALDRALEHVGAIGGDAARFAEKAVIDDRIRIADSKGDTGLAAQLAARRLETESDGGIAAALALRIAEHAATKGDTARALEALSRAVGHDAGCLPARALQLDVLAEGSDAAAFAAQLEAFAEHLATDEARGRAFLVAAYVWSVRAQDVAGAKAALSQASLYGVAPSFTGRMARALASMAGDFAWYEEATKRLISAGATEVELVPLHVELARLRAARGDVEGAAKAVSEMAAVPSGLWLARALEAFLPSPPAASPGNVEETVSTAGTAGTRARAALEELAAVESDPQFARALALLAVLRARAAGDLAGARAQLRALAERDASDAVVTSLLIDLDRAAGDCAAAAKVASDAAVWTTDPEHAAALHLEAAFERWREGDRRAAIEQMESAAAGAPEAARMALAWAGRGLDVDDVEARRRAIERAAAAGAADPRALALERFALEVAGGDPEDAGHALASLERGPDGVLETAGALARLLWSRGASEADAVRDAASRLGECGPVARVVAAAEETRLARESEDPENHARAASRWFDAGGGLPAALEWLVAALSARLPGQEREARLAMAASLPDEAKQALLASAALLEAEAQEPSGTAPLVPGATAAVRLVNLELAPPGCDPRRRAATLTELGDGLGDDAVTDAAALGGWSALVASDMEAARAAFEAATAARPVDLASWEGLRTCGERAGDKTLRARAAAELGALCTDDARGASFWEEAGLLWLELGQNDDAERAFEASFTRDGARAVAFDKLFRRVRERKEGDRLLALIARRLEFADGPQEIQKLYWEQARTLREKGEQDAALTSLEHVTMLDPDHVGALALLGEINIRRGNFAEAAGALARLAQLDGAPPKNRVTAGVAAVDLYENKLEQFDQALDVLRTLHAAKLSTLPVRERLAKAAARTGSWKDATAILEVLMVERPEPEGRIEAARLAMAIHRDRLNDSQGAVGAIVKLLEEAPTDGEALDMLLFTEHPRPLRDRLLKNARAGLVESLQVRPTDVPSVQRIVTIARALDDDALRQAGIGALLCLGAADAQAEQTFAQLAARKVRTPQIAVGEAMMKTILAPGDSGPLADLFVMLGPTLAESLGPNLQATGVTRRDRIDPRSGIALRNEIAAWAGAFGVPEFDLYVGGKDPLGVQGIAGEPHALVIGSGVNAPLAPMTRARVARELLAMVRGTSITRSRDEITIAAVVVAACHLAEVHIEHPPYAVLAEIERLLGKAMSRKTKKSITDACHAIVRTKADARAWSRRALASHDRIATIASGDPSMVLTDVLGTTPERLAQAVVGNKRGEDLLRFVLSPQYVDIRRALGLEGMS